MSSSTVTRTEVEAVEKEYAVCPNCEMEYEPERMQEFACNPESELSGKVECETVHSLCPNCCDSVFSWKPASEQSKLESVKNSAEEHPTFFIGLGIGAVLAGILGVFGGLLAGAGSALLFSSPQSMMDFVVTNPDKAILSTISFYLLVAMVPMLLRGLLRGEA